MKKLSERLWDMRVHTPDLDEDDLATLDEAAELARSFEAAPVVVVQQGDDWGCESTVIDIPGEIPVGQRVRVFTDGQKP